MEDKLRNDILCGTPFGGTAILVRKSRGGATSSIMGGGVQNSEKNFVPPPIRKLGGTRCL